MDCENKDQERRFTGGISWKSYGVPRGIGFPVADLVLGGGRVRLGPNDPSATFWGPLHLPDSMPWLDLSYDAVMRVERVRHVLGLPGIRLRFRDADNPIIFWTWHPSQVLEAFERRGIEVDLTPHWTGLFGI